MNNCLKHMTFAATALFMFSCSNDLYNEGNEKENSNGNEKQFVTAVQEMIEEDGKAYAPSRTSLAQGNTVEWSVGDAINLFDGTSNRKFTATSTGTQTVFQAESAVVSGKASRYLALYPYDMKVTFGENTISNVTLPANQAAVAGGFDPACNIMTASVNDVETTLAFKHVCSYVKVQPAFDCSRLVIIFAEDAKVAGTFDVAVADDGTPSVQNITEASNKITLLGDIKAGKDYYVAVLPGSYKGFKVEMEAKLTKEMVDYSTMKINTSVYYKETTNTIEMSRAKTKSLGTLSASNMNQNAAQYVSFEDLGYGDDINAAHGRKVLWAKFNLGAETETENGNYYAWGEVTPRDNAYTAENYLCNDYYPETLDLAHDAAAVTFGRGWKTPSTDEFTEMKENSIWVYTDNYEGCKGFFVYPAGKKNDGTVIRDYQKMKGGTVYHINSGYNETAVETTDEEVINYVNSLSPDKDKHLFIKFAGLKQGSVNAQEEGHKGAYWTGGRGTEVLPSASISGAHAAYYLGMNNDGIGVFNMKSHWNACFHGLTIRPVIILEW